MNWDALGSLGEVIGALAVVATLIYLAIQTKQTKEAVELGSAVSTQDLYSNWRTTLLENPHIAKIIVTANSGGELTEEEKVTFHFLCDEVFFAACVSFLTSKQQRGESSAQLQTEYFKQMIAVIPGTIPEWDRLRPITKVIAPELDQVVREHESMLSNQRSRSYDDA